MHPWLLTVGIDSRLCRRMKALPAPAGDLLALTVPFPDGPLRLREQRRDDVPIRRDLRWIAQLMTSTPCGGANVLVGVPVSGAVCQTPARGNRVPSIPHHKSAVAPRHADPSGPRQILKDALTLVRRLDSITRETRTSVQLLHVIDKVPLYAPRSTPEATRESRSNIRSDGEMIIHEAKTAVRSGGIDVDERLIEAIGARIGPLVICAAADWPAHLIVCGTHGRGGLARMLLGSDAEYIVRHSSVAVLIVRSPPA